MNPDRLWEILREKGAYRTPADLDRGLLDRILGNWSPWYYQKMVRIVAAMSRHAGRKSGITRDLWAHYQVCILNAVEACRGRFEIDGFKNLQDATPPFVVVSNHMAMAETLFMPVLLQPFTDITFVVKESLMSYPFIGKILHAVDAIPVTRENPREDLRQVLGRGQEYLERGGSVIVFPQATRSIQFEPEQFNSIGVKLAQRAGVPVVPAALKTDFQSPGRLLKDFGPVYRDRPLHFRFGEQIPVGTPTKEAHARTVELIQNSLAEWRVDT